jgi:hypothetical protein
MPEFFNSASIFVSDQYKQIRVSRHSGDREAEAQANPDHGAQRISLPSRKFRMIQCPDTGFHRYDD